MATKSVYSSISVWVVKDKKTAREFSFGDENIQKWMCIFEQDYESTAMQAVLWGLYLDKEVLWAKC